VLLGFKNGGKAAYTIEGGATRLEVAVAATTRVSKERDRARLDRGPGNLGPHRVGHGDAAGAGPSARRAKADPAWSHRLSGPAGELIGTLTLMRTAEGWSMQDFVRWTATWDVTGLGASAPSAGASLQLDAPTGEVLADLLVAALLDASTLPRGYIA